MAIPLIIQDGTQPYGTGSPITIGATTYVVESETITQQQTTAEDFHADGTPNRKRWTKGRYNHDLTLQLATGSTAYPTPGATYTRTPPNEASAVTFVVPFTVPFAATNSAGAIRTLQFTAESVVNSITTIA